MNSAPLSRDHSPFDIDTPRRRFTEAWLESVKHVEKETGLSPLFGANTDHPSRLMNVSSHTQLRPRFDRIKEIINHPRLNRGNQIFLCMMINYYNHKQAAELFRIIRAGFADIIYPLSTKQRELHSALLINYVRWDK